jgi:hypothetical protein
MLHHGGGNGLFAEQLGEYLRTAPGATEVGSASSNIS